MKLAHESRVIAAALLLWLLGLLYLGSAAKLQVTPLADFQAYLSAFRAYSSGSDPYLASVEYPYLYSPAWLLFLKPFQGVSDQGWRMIATFLSIMGNAVILHSALGILRWQPTYKAWLAILFVLFVGSQMSFLNQQATMNAEVWCVAWILLALRNLSSPRYFFYVAMAALLKPQYLLLALFSVLRGGSKLGAVSAIAVVLLWQLLPFAFHPEWFISFLEALSRQGAEMGHINPALLQAILVPLGTGPELTHQLTLSWIGVGLFAFWWLGRKRSAKELLLNQYLLGFIILSPRIKDYSLMLFCLVPLAALKSLFEAKLSRYEKWLIAYVVVAIAFIIFGRNYYVDALASMLAYVNLGLLIWGLKKFPLKA